VKRVHTAELEPGMWVDTPLGRLCVVSNNMIYTRKNTQYWRTVFGGINVELLTIDVHIVSPSDYWWAV